MITSKKDSASYSIFLTPQLIPYLYFPIIISVFMVLRKPLSSLLLFFAKISIENAQFIFIDDIKARYIYRNNIKTTFISESVFL